MKDQVNFIHEILSIIFTAYQKKNLRNDKRLSFVKAYFASFLEDLAAHDKHQHIFADKVIQTFEELEKPSMPVFEQGIYQLMDSTQENRKQLPELKKVFEKTILEPIGKSLTKHPELQTLVEKCVKGFEYYKELQAKASKDYEVYVNSFNTSMTEGKKKATVDIFTEAHKYASTIQSLVVTLVQVCEDLIRLKPFAMAKEKEYLKALIKAFNEYCLFTQQHFGQLTASTLQKARFSFDRVGSIEPDI